MKSRPQLVLSCKPLYYPDYSLVDVTWNKLCEVTSSEITWKAECSLFPITVVSFCLDIVMFETSQGWLQRNRQHWLSQTQHPTKLRTGSKDRQKASSCSVRAQSLSLTGDNAPTLSLLVDPSKLTRCEKSHVRKGTDFFRFTRTAAEWLTAL